MQHAAHEWLSARRLALAAAALAWMAVAPSVWAQQEDAARNQDDAPRQDAAEPEAPKSHTGEFVKAGEGEFTMTVRGENQHSHKVTDETRVTINGEDASLEELKQGDRIKVTMGENNVALAVEAARRDAPNQDQPMPSERPRQRDDAAPTRPERPRDVPRDGQQPPQAGEQPQANGRRSEIGIMISGTFRDGAVIQGVMSGGPAQDAGLQSGDVILAVGGQQVNSPRDAVNFITSAEPGQQITITVRRGEEAREIPVTPVARRSAGFRGEEPRQPQADFNGRQNGRQDQPQTPWLGVSLAQSEQEGEAAGVPIEAVFPSSPAARAGLRSGDVIIRADAQQVSSPEDLVKIIEGLTAGDELALEIARGEGEPREMTVILAGRADFLGQRQPLFDTDDPTNPFGQGSGQFGGGNIPEHAMMLEQHRRLAEQHQRLEEAIRALHEEVRQLREELQGRRPRQGGERPRLEDRETDVV
ncbi:MAG: PDZ domain-containing protein, partial [Planctomycetaceae bacterium]